MSNNTQTLLQHIFNQIKELAEQSHQYEHLVLQDACFDDLLFKPLSIKRTGYQQYINEIQYYYQKLDKLIDNQEDINSHSEQINYLSEKLINQISALSREFATYKSRKTTNSQDKITIFEKHAQYLGHLRKLEWIKSELQKNQQSQQKIQQVNERIERCQYAIRLVEHDIELLTVID